jgi:hypothetical protein
VSRNISDKYRSDIPRAAEEMEACRGKPTMEQVGRASGNGGKSCRKIEVASLLQQTDDELSMIKKRKARRDRWQGGKTREGQGKRRARRRRARGEQDQ